MLSAPSTKPQLDGHMNAHIQEMLSLPQLIGYAALVIYVAGYRFRNDNTLKIVFSVSNVFWIVHYYMIHAQTAALTTAIVTVRNVLSLNAETFSIKRRMITAWIFTVVLLAAGVVTWVGWISVIPVSTTIAATHAMLYMRGVSLRKVFFVIDAAWLVHAVVVLSFGGFVYAFCALIVNAHTIFKMSKDPVVGPTI